MVKTIINHPPIWEWFIPPIYIEIADGLFLLCQHYSSNFWAMQHCYIIVFQHFCVDSPRSSSSWSLVQPNETTRLQSINQLKTKQFLREPSIFMTKKSFKMFRLTLSSRLSHDKIPWFFRRFFPLAAPWMAASMTNKPLSLVQLHGIFKQGIWVGSTPSLI